MALVLHMLHPNVCEMAVGGVLQSSHLAKANLITYRLHPKGCVPMSACMFLAAVGGIVHRHHLILSSCAPNAYSSLKTWEKFV